MTSKEQAAIRFAEKLCNNWLGLGAGDYSGLRKVFTEPELVEVVTLCAWQFGGPAMLTSWGAEGYKKNGRVVLEELPVRLAYSEVAKTDAPPPPIPRPPLLPLEELLDRATRRQSPPPGWLLFLSPHPFLASTWSALYETVVEGGIVERRIKQLQRLLLAERVDCHAWAPDGSPVLVAAGIGSAERKALRAFDLGSFSPRERAALRYAEGLVGSGQVEDTVFDELKEHFSETEIVELGYAVSVQNGASRVFRSLVESARPVPRPDRPIARS